MPDLSHFDDSGASRMVDVGDKQLTRRSAVAAGQVRMQPATLTMIHDRTHAKGDVLAVARLAGIMSAKRTAELIPLCHSLPLESVTVDFAVRSADLLQITAEVHVTAKTGVEMEALCAVSTAALTVYDMCKSVDRGMQIEFIHLVHKQGGKSGEYRR